MPGSPPGLAVGGLIFEALDRRSLTDTLVSENITLTAKDQELVRSLLSDPSQAQLDSRRACSRPRGSGIADLQGLLHGRLQQGHVVSLRRLRPWRRPGAGDRPKGQADGLIGGGAIATTARLLRRRQAKRAETDGPIQPPLHRGPTLAISATPFRISGRLFPEPLPSAKTRRARRLWSTTGLPPAPDIGVRRSGKVSIAAA